MTPELAFAMREDPGIELLRRYAITWVDCAGDEGGIMCRLDLGVENRGGALVVSITHLRFRSTGPLAREIAGYQRHRVKRFCGTAGGLAASLSSH